MKRETVTDWAMAILVISVVALVAYGIAQGMGWTVRNDSLTEHLTALTTTVCISCALTIAIFES